MQAVFFAVASFELLLELMHKICINSCTNESLNILTHFKWTKIYKVCYNVGGKVSLSRINV